MNEFALLPNEFSILLDVHDKTERGVETQEEDVDEAREEGARDFHARDTPHHRGAANERRAPQRAQAAAAAGVNPIGGHQNAGGVAHERLPLDDFRMFFSIFFRSLVHFIFINSDFSQLYY
jgi:hypothetical protein